MQQHPPHHSLTARPEAFLNERVTELARFRRIFAKVNAENIEQLDYRRERQVYLLTDGKRSIAQIAFLLGISPVEVAHMARLLVERGYVEYIPHDEQTSL